MFGVRSRLDRRWHSGREGDGHERGVRERKKVIVVRLHLALAVRCIRVRSAQWCDGSAMRPLGTVVDADCSKTFICRAHMACLLFILA